MTEIGALMAAVKTCRDTRNDPNQRQHYNDSPLTVEEFIQIVATTSDPLDVVDLGGRREVRTRAGMTSGDVAQLRQVPTCNEFDGNLTWTWTRNEMV
jgi:hypothetical protein